MTESAVRGANQVAAGMQAYAAHPAPGAASQAEVLQQWARRQSEAVTAAV